MTAILKITDGTEATEIDLLSLPGFQLESWRPQIAGYKGDGVFQSSPLAPGRQLVNKQFDNIIETFQFKAQDVSQDALIEDVQNLVRMLEKATSYWSTDWQDTPVYIEAKATEETNTRYGHIMSYRIPELENPYSQPFLQRKCESVMDNLTLIIEHTPWTENVPGVGTAVPISSVETFDSRNLGNVNSSGIRDPTTAQEDYVSSKWNTFNLTHIYINDGGVFGANLMDAALPYNLLPAIPAVGDILYFGIEEQIVFPTTRNGPFNSLVFDIGTVGAGYTGIWEYCTNAVGPAFGALTVQDNTNANGIMTGISFDTSSVKSVHWEQPSNWVTCTINGVTGYWIRYRITGIPGALTAPTQQNRNIYTITWSYVQIESTAIAGDIVSKLKIEVRPQADSDLGSTLPDAWVSRMIVGLRSTSRGSSFTPYINLDIFGAFFQTPTDIRVGGSAGFPGVVTANTDLNSATGISSRISNATAAFNDAINISFNTSAIGEEYDGKYHAFIRGTQINGSIGDIRVRLAFYQQADLNNLPVGISDEASFSALNVIELLDLGKVEINTKRNGESLTTLLTTIQAFGNGTTDFDVYDLILMPVDEYVLDTSDVARGEVSVGDRSSVSGGYTYFSVDNISYPKQTISAVKINGSETVNSWYLIIQNARPFTQSNAQQKLWFLFARNPTTSDTYWVSEITPSFTVLTFKNQQYITMRGDR